MRPIPISAAGAIAVKFGYDQVIIIARKVGKGDEPHGEHVTTYGRNKLHCEVARRIGEFIRFKIMKWPKEKLEDM